MIEYEKAGGVLDIREISAKKHFEKYWRRRKNRSSNTSEDTNMDINGDFKTTDSWEVDD